MLGLVEFMYLGASLVAQVDPYNDADLHRPSILRVVAPAAESAPAATPGSAELHAAAECQAPDSVGNPDRRAGYLPEPNARRNAPRHPFSGVVCGFPVGGKLPIDPQPLAKPPMQVAPSTSPVEKAAHESLPEQAAPRSQQTSTD
jgi:hypothetical protein